MLTPKHRALFAAAYATQLLKSASDDNELAPAAAPSGEPSGTKPDEAEGADHKS